MRLQTYIFSLFLVLMNLSMQAQSTEIYNNPLEEYNRAIQLYNEKQYQSAQILFKKVQDDQKSYEILSDCAYYIANCAIRLNQANGDVLMEDFVKNYPTSSKQNQAYIEVAHYYFDEGNYPQALQWFEKVDESNLTPAEREKFTFQKGYAYFSAGKKKEASNQFKKVENSQEFGSQAKYYLGYMSYESDDYKEANEYFEKVDDQEKYKEKMAYYQADMNFKLGNFQKAID
uniref:tetratricopeptide repeat protein n=1 Tax=Flavobacterium sp. TaxID=239 RepID=UPI0037BFAD7C